MKNTKQNIIFFLFLFFLCFPSCDKSDPIKTRLIVICIGDEIDDASSSYKINNGTAINFPASEITTTNGVSVFDKVFENIDEIWVQSTSKALTGDKPGSMQILLYEDSGYIDSEVIVQNNSASLVELSATFQYPP